MGRPVPSLLLQPMVENAIKYAVTPQEEGADIWKPPGAKGSCGIRIEVPENGNGEGSEFAASTRPASVWRTFGTVCRRPMVANHRFETRQNDRGGFSVIIEIPYETKTRTAK